MRNLCKPNFELNRIDQFLLTLPVSFTRHNSSSTSFQPIHSLSPLAERFFTKFVQIRLSFTYIENRYQTDASLSGARSMLFLKSSKRCFLTPSRVLSSVLSDRQNVAGFKLFFIYICSSREHFPLNFYFRCEVCIPFDSHTRFYHTAKH